MTQPQPSSISVRSLMAGVGAWFGAGIPMGLGPLIGLPAAKELLAHSPSSDVKGMAGAWVGYWVAAFLLGGACGGWCFGVMGDRYGRVRTLAASIICYSGFTLLSAAAASTGQMLILRFLAGLGMGGTWPLAASLVAEAWPSASRPLAAGVLGAAANLGILLIAMAGGWINVTAWRTVTLVSAVPIGLAIWVWFAVPESSKWLEKRAGSSKEPHKGTTAVVFGPQYRRRTVVGILLAAIPLVGAWASGKWIMPWSQVVVGTSAPTQQAWAAGAVLGAAAGGWLANQFGRRTTYFAISLLTLSLNLLIYSQLTPASPLFRAAVFVLGMVGTVFFGWLPLYLPELFPTEIRATGTGVTFNFGRFITVGCVFGASELLRRFGDDYGQVGAATAWVYALGMIVILLAPDLSQPRSETTGEST